VSETKSPQDARAMGDGAIATIVSGHLRGLRELIASRGVHPARTVVLMPFKQLLPPARETWAQLVPDGFSPHFETTRTWSDAEWFEPGTGDFAGDIARDLLAAHGMLDRAGFASHAQLLAPRVVEAASQLAPAASAIHPSQRGAWAQRAGAAIASGFDAPQLTHEAVVARIAVEWVAASAFATDVLHDDNLREGVDLLVVVQGLGEDALAAAIANRFGDAACVIHLASDEASAPRGAIALHAAKDPSDEAERAAACVLNHVREGRTPVALAAIDRVLTRRIRAMLEQGGAAIRDETGWKLSTTRAGAHVMLALRACLGTASTDAVIDWMKNSPSWAAASVSSIERRIRRAGVREWRSVRAGDLAGAIFDEVASLRDGMRLPRDLPRWLASTKAVLEVTGQWQELERDPAGVQAIAALRIADADRDALGAFPPALRRMSLAEFIAWANDTLEAANFNPPSADDAQVVILPLHQLLARGFTAVVMPGCDEMRLPASPDPSGVWTVSQRAVLGLPSREELESQSRQAWRHALGAPHCDIFWRCADGKGETVLPSFFVQQLQLEGQGAAQSDARDVREIAAHGTDHPHPSGQQLAIDQLTQGAYEDLRKCPYRFFALRQLGLQEPDEIDKDLDKRDFGNWLHRVLSVFHTRLAQDPASHRASLLDNAAQEVTREMRLDEGEFLPFSAAWVQAREGYLAWLEDHEATEGASFASAESEHERVHEGVRLFGRVDRIDVLRNGSRPGSRMVMDYKTENIDKTRARVRDPGEDTQLAFYAALLGDDDLRAAYVNIGEGGETKMVEQPDDAAARNMLLAGIARDVSRIAEGMPLDALGEGAACEFCAARGLCRKDFWE